MLLLHRYWLETLHKKTSSPVFEQTEALFRQAKELSDP